MAQEELNLVSEKVLNQAANPSLLAYCPSMDLVALGTTEQQILIYRLNGQRVHVVTQKSSSLKVQSIKWKPNGQLLAIGWSDGFVRLIGTESKKIVHQISTEAHEKSGITCIGWVSNATGKKGMSAGKFRVKQPWSDVIEQRWRRDDGSDALDLPRDLGLIDLEASLPKLSVLPASGTLEDIFSSQNSLDGLFRAFDPKDNDVVDVMVVGTEDGRLHLSIYDSFIIGSFPSPLSAYNSIGSKSRLILHAANKSCSTHGLLMSSGSTSGEAYFVPMDLRFISSSSEYLSLLASKSTMLQNLLRYLHQVQSQMTAEWQSSRDLPTKFLRNIDEKLQENTGYDIKQGLYHLCATGHVFPEMGEWLVDELAERGHKRWDKAVTTGLENLRKLVHENMLPALERFALILSRLAGIVKYQESNENMGFSNAQIKVVMDTLACLNLVSARILTLVVDEIDLFAAFSAWLRHEIDRLASEAASSAADDNLDKELAIDCGKVFRYIQTALSTSPLSKFLDKGNAEVEKSDWQTAEQEHPLFELLDKQLRKQEEGLPHMEALPKVEFLCKYLTQQATSVFQQFAEAEKRNVLLGDPISLGKWSTDIPIAMRLCPKGSHCTAYVAMISEEKQNSLRLIKIQLLVENGISSNSLMAETNIDFQNLLIDDFVFVDDQRLLVLCHPKGKLSGILSIPYKNSDSVLSYRPSSGTASAVITHTVDSILDTCGKYSIPETNFVPHKLEVSESNKKHNRDDLARLCILDKDRLRYKVFTLPKVSEGRGGDDQDVAMSQ